ncbi:hypothetical protein [Clostridium ganghwense]|uniref:Uncharacterized protein n=1 Tax=Clostridium ganghwense TaxID=312089 RepID=A0ABT4CQV0_9CLOT|nr:hypothetical protein [Clostridium ganghwense]MCY6371409.1 hypothetical protein [Clostridium ganghwense]
MENSIFLISIFLFAVYNVRLYKVSKGKKVIYPIDIVEVIEAASFKN